MRELRLSEYMRAAVFIVFCWLAMGLLGILFGEIQAALGLVAIIFTLQYLAFLPSFIMQTERFYDFVGALSFVVSVSWIWWTSVPNDLQYLIGGLMISWSIRLGLHLTLRAYFFGDTRFSKIKMSGIRYLKAWTMQGVWVVTCSLPLIVSDKDIFELTTVSYFCVAFFMIGLIIETVADYQKIRFKFNNRNRSKFINSGLWRYVQHPNYLGEIIIWWSIYILVIVNVQGIALLTIITPVIVTLLLTKVSGIPMLLERSKKQWGGNQEWESYIANTPRLFPSVTRNSNARRHRMIKRDSKDQ